MIISYNNALLVPVLTSISDRSNSIWEYFQFIAQYINTLFSDSTSAKYTILSFTLLHYMWDLFLDIRQYRLCKRTVNVPLGLQNVIHKGIYDNLRLFEIDRMQFQLLESLFSMIIAVTVIFSGTFAKLWEVSEYLNPLKEEVSTSCIWSFFWLTISSAFELPFTIYDIFYIKDFYGLNQSDYDYFLQDTFKYFVLKQVVLVPCSSILVLIIRNGGKWFFFWLWFAVCLATTVVVTVYSKYVFPVLNVYKSLPEGELKKDIENFTNELNFPLKEIVVIEGSERTLHSNVYIIGVFGAKQIILYDALFAGPGSGGCKTDEILAILAHELGHWRHKHLIKLTVLLGVNLLLSFAVFSLVFKNPSLYTAAGFPEKVTPVVVGLVILFQYVLMLHHDVLVMGLNIISRRFEYKADVFAARLGRAEPLKRALNQLYKKNMFFPVYDSWYSTWRYSRPTFLQRIEALEKYT